MEGLLLTALEHVAVGVYVLDDRGQILFANRAFAEMVGLSPQELVGVNVLAASPHYQESVSEMVYREKRKVVMFQDMTFLEKPEGLPRRFRMITSSTPVFDNRGQVVNVVATCEPFYLINEKYRAAQESQVERLSLRRGSAGVLPPVKGPAMSRVFEMLEKVAATDSSVLLWGESGVGKDICAGYLHENSLRRDKPFVVINCGAMPENLLEAELFGYAGGAFTGALPKGKRGLLSLAEGGTLFLNELNALPLALQGKLLRVLESKRVRPLGGEQEVETDFRLVCAANEDLKELCRLGKFREDLYYRVTVVPVRVPPLRERKEEILLLAGAFLQELSRKYGKELTLSGEAQAQLLRHTWPGNVRELRNLIERLLVTMREGVAVVEQLPETFFERRESSRPPAEPEELILLDTQWGLRRLGRRDFSLRQYLEDCEKELLRSVLAEVGSTYRAAELLQVSQPTVVRRKQKYGL